MMLTFALVVLAQAPASGPVKLASVGFTHVRVPAEVATSFEETFALRLGETGVARVTTQRDVANLLGVERQKQLLGCADASTSCVAELAGALGVEGLITGEIARVGSLYQLTIKVLNARDGRVLFQSLKRLRSEEDVLDELDRTAVEAARRLRTELRGGVEPVTVTSPERTVSTRPAAPWVLFGAGAAVAVAGGVLQGLAASDWNTLRAGQGLTEQSARQLYDGGTLKQGLGLTLLGVGGAALVGGLVWSLLGSPTQPVAFWLHGDAGGFALAGHW